MSQPIYKALLEKSVHAAISSIEVYNKPDFKYREENFAILLINAWELMLKAKLIKHHRNVKSIYIYENKNKKDGNKAKSKTLKKNWCGTPQTLSINKCLEKCTNTTDLSLSDACVYNIQILIEIRDSAIHFYNFEKLLSRKVYEVGAASLRNYMTLIKEWFGYDLSRYNFYLMPLSFFHEFDSIDSFSINSLDKQTKSLLNYIIENEKGESIEGDNRYSISMNLNTKLNKSKESDAINIKITTNPNSPTAQTILLKEADMKEKYPFVYAVMVRKFKSRYIDFLSNRKFIVLLNEMKKSDKYSYKRLLDPENPKSICCMWYSTEVFKLMDSNYSKR